MGKRIFLFLVTNLADRPDAVDRPERARCRATTSRRGRHRHRRRWRSSASSGAWAAPSSRCRCRAGLPSARPACSWSTAAPGNRDADWLYQTVERLARQANLPMPEVGVYDSPEVNAFATGPSKSRSLVAVSSGLMRGDATRRGRGRAGARSRAHRQRRHGDDDAAAGRDQRLRHVLRAHHRLRVALTRRRPQQQRQQLPVVHRAARSCSASSGRWSPRGSRDSASSGQTAAARRWPDATR